MVNLRHLQHFLVLAEELHVRRSARRLGLSQPTLTRAIRALEDQLGFDLLVRDGHRIVDLTAAGGKYRQDVRRLIADLDRAGRTALDIAEGRTGRLRLGISEDATTKTLVGILATYREQFPDISVELSELPAARLASALRQNEVDIALMVPVDDEPALAVEPLWRENWCVAFPPNHPIANLKLVRSENLRDLPLVLAHPDLAPGGHTKIREALRAAGVSPLVALQAFHRSTMILMAAAGTGVTFVPASLAASTIAGVVMRPFAADRQVIAAMYRADDPPGLAMQFLRIAQELTREAA